MRMSYKDNSPYYKKQDAEESAPRKPQSPRKHGAKLLRSLARPAKRQHHESPSRNGQSERMGTSPYQQQQQQKPSPSSTTGVRTAILTSYDPQQHPHPSMHSSSPVASARQHGTSMSLSSDDADEHGETRLEKQSWFNFSLCGSARNVLFEQEEEDDDKMEIASSSSSSSNDSFYAIPHDPTVQESIECVFAHGQEGESFSLASPAALLQSRVPSRRFASRKSSSDSLIHLGTYDPALGRVVPPPTPVSTTTMEDVTATASPKQQQGEQQRPSCPCLHGVCTPLVPPEQWPQRPLMLRPTPNSGMRILGIRYSSSTEYLWKEGDPQDTIAWREALLKKWQGANYTGPTIVPTCCSQCMILPINNGNEAHGQALVVDFESPLFRGTMLVRVRYANGTTQQPYDDSKGYFKGMNRRYQIVIRGHFLESIPWTKCVAGVELDRPVGNLPPKWIVQGALKVISFFAPQLKASTEGQHPYSVSPFGSTPQTLRIDDHAQFNETMEDMHHEPIHDHHTLLGKASKHSSSLHRARWRKRNFDKLHVAESPTPVTIPHTKVYTFEFLQHLLNMREFTIELGSMLGHVELKETLDGQALQIMAKHTESDKVIWKFDLWHECLVEDAKRYDPRSEV